MDTGITIKQALFEDLDAIMKIENDCFRADAFSRHQMAYLITRSKGIFIIACHNDEIAAYMSFIISARHNTGRIYSIAVAPDHRGAGIADILMDKTIRHSLENNLRAIFLEVRTDNKAAIQLYQKKGFITHTVKKNYYNDGAPAYSMVLRLQ
jgi:ribosomal-protein-alanine acetyltransferase